VNFGELKVSQVHQLIPRSFEFLKTGPLRLELEKLALLKLHFENVQSTNFIFLKISSVISSESN
jgi:hypothetical protein